MMDDIPQTGPPPASRRLVAPRRRALLGMMIAACALTRPGRTTAGVASWPLAPDPGSRSGTGNLLRIADEDAYEIGRRIWHNESAGRVAGLTHWNTRQNFAELGIGHFTWFPAGLSLPYTEAFPGLLATIAGAGRRIPAWLHGQPACPWSTRAAFHADFHGPRMVELRALMLDTVALQARYAADRLEAALPSIIDAAPPGEATRLIAHIEALAHTRAGVYALVDYVNFKGEGVNPGERYQGEGWGLLQVLLAMKDAAPGSRAVAAFVRAANVVLTRRVLNAPPSCADGCWLKGWRARLRTYLA
jgi:hypothetical protein